LRVSRVSLAPLSSSSAGFTGRSGDGEGGRGQFLVALGRPHLAVVVGLGLVFAAVASATISEAHRWGTRTWWLFQQSLWGPLCMFLGPGCNLYLSLGPTCNLYHRQF
jgi:hypothetical protein